MKKIIRILPIQPSVQQVTLDFERAVWKALRSARGEHVKGRGGLPSFSLLMRPRHFFFRPSSPPKQNKTMIGPTLERFCVETGGDGPYTDSSIMSSKMRKSRHLRKFNGMMQN